jgi:hypothetical protein
MIDLDVDAYVLLSDAKRHADGRRECLRQLAEVAATESHRRIVLERDESIERSDRRALYADLTRCGATDRVTYSHASAHEEPLLWVADAIAWSYAKGGEWRKRVGPMIKQIEPPQR